MPETSYANVSEGGVNYRVEGTGVFATEAEVEATLRPRSGLQSGGVALATGECVDPRRLIVKLALSKGLPDEGPDTTVRYALDAATHEILRATPLGERGIDPASEGQGDEGQIEAGARALDPHAFKEILPVSCKSSWHRRSHSSHSACGCGSSVWDTPEGWAKRFAERRDTARRTARKVLEAVNG